MTKSSTLEVPETQHALLRPAFARHETFHPRFGWLRKGFEAVSSSEDIFLRNDAPAELGVGKNMVRAIRYWSLAYKVIGETPDLNRPRLKIAGPTKFGTQLLGEDGWDPYLERSGSLWLLHWKLLSAPCLAPAWHIGFNHFSQVEFTDEDLLRALRGFCDSQEQFADIVDASLKKDVDCLVRMFAGAVASGEVAEDSLDSPFVELDLIRRVPGSRRHYSFNVGPKASLPDEVVVYACCDFLAELDSSSRVFNLSALTHPAGSPGRVFKLAETSLFDSLDRFAQRSSLLSVEVTAGVRQLVLGSTPVAVAEAALASFYEQRSEWLA